jgi:triosephosphate isomerase
MGETDELVNKKLQAIAGIEIIPVLCIGEKLEIREAGGHISFVLGQLEKALAGVDAGISEKLIIAYEPVWAIGTGVNATAEQAKEMADAIRGKLAEIFPGKEISVLYGGSVNGDNVEDLVANSGCDGFLVGGASLKPDHFIKICKSISNLSN